MERGGGNKRIQIGRLRSALRAGVAKEDSSEPVRSEFPDLPAKLQEYLMNVQDRFNSNLFFYRQFKLYGWVGAMAIT